MSQHATVDLDVYRASAERLASAAELIAPLLDPAARAIMSDALARVAARRVRILVLGEAKRGKSTLVNALFGAELLPTGVLPVTSVATEVTVGEAGSESARVRYLDGRERPIGLDEVAGLVSEAGNPSNVKQVDRVAVTAPSPYLPLGTEVVDTPGTGSVISANTEESARARALMDLAVLVVAADPPVAAAELTLATDAVATAAGIAVVINKTDLVGAEQLPEIVEFTRRVVRDALGVADIPVFPTVLRGEPITPGHSTNGKPRHGLAEDAELSATRARPESGGFGRLVDWLGTRLAERGELDLLSSTARALRRQALGVRDQLRVEEALLRESDEANATVREQLRHIVDQARLLAAAANDRVDGESRRLRQRLDAEHDEQLAEALRHARDRLGDRLPAGPGGPEDRAGALRERIIDSSRDRATAWFTTVSTELSSALEAVGEETLSGLDADLRRARESAERLLGVPLSTPDQPEPLTPPEIPTLHIGQEAVWRELVTSSVAEHLPAGIRARRLHRQLATRLPGLVGRPFGRVRATLQAWLDDAARTARRGLASVWDDELDALRKALDAVARLDDSGRAETEHRASTVAGQLARIADAVAELDILIDQGAGQ